MFGIHFPLKASPPQKKKKLREKKKKNQTNGTDKVGLTYGPTALVHKKPDQCHQTYTRLSLV